MQALIERGILATSLVVNYSHSEADIAQTIEAFAQALVIYRRALDEGIDKYLKGRPVKPAIRSHA
jgi:glutamate-1-semialdehyde 2,1-aminomutase